MKKTKVKVTQGTLSKRDAYTEKLRKYFPVGFRKVMDTTLNIPRDCPEKQSHIRVL